MHDCIIVDRHGKLCLWFFYEAVMYYRLSFNPMKVKTRS